MTTYTLTTPTGTFAAVRRKYLDVNGNPVFMITHEDAETNHLPYVKGYRRNNNKGYYLTQSYNIEHDLEHFIQAYNKALSL